MKNSLFVFLSLFALSLSAQLDPSCQLDIGTNLGGLADFGTELPFVNLMHNAREWYTKDVGNPNAAFNSDQATNLAYRPDGYPTHVPQNISESTFPQEVVTIWGRTAGWPAGEYVVLWDGTGELRLFGSFSNLTETGPGRITFDLVPQPEGVVEIAIESSVIGDPVHNIRLIMPGHEATYEDQPFNPTWLDKLSPFKTVRFMDWGQTNNWGQARGEGWDNPAEFDWSERSQMDHYTWAYEKGIPYEMMVKLINDYDLDGWVCVPHRASPDYIAGLAAYLRDNVEPERHLYVEYSNETWNWIFGQAQWLNKYGCEQTGTSWPEGIVPYVQRCMDGFTTAFAGQLDRITRVVGTQLSWVDVSQRIVNNMTPGSFDAVTPTWYFGFTDTGEAELDALGTSATVDDVADRAEEGLAQSFVYLEEQLTEVANPLGLPLVFYEGGQHLTPTPFGVMPTYADALIDVQRSPRMYDLYSSWMNSIRQLQSGNEPLLLMHFSFVAPRSPQFGSWGILETMDQDTNLIPAPKYSAVLNNMAGFGCEGTLAVEWGDYEVGEADCGAKIRWSTRSEEDNSHFIVSRSSGTNGAFRPVGRVNATNNSDGGAYEFSEADLPSGNYTYRIQQVDRDGGTSSLGMRTVEVSCSRSGSKLLLSPNPVGEVLRLSGDFTEAGRIEILSADGRLLFQQNLNRIGDSRIATGQLPPGIYYALVYPNRSETVIRKRFVKE